jgi:hypothetical protein
MKAQEVSSALERLEGQAGEFLEDKIAVLETEQHIKVKEVEVALIPDDHGGSPAVAVIVTT